MKNLVELLGLPEEATESEITGTIMAMKEAALRQAQGAEEMATLRGTLAELKSRAVKRDAADVVASAMKEGKVTPSQKDWAMQYAEADPEGFKVFAAKAPVVIPQGETGAARVERTIDAVDAVQSRVNGTLAIDEETFRKHNK